MKFAKIKFDDRGTAAEALVGMAQRGRVTVLPEDVFIVPEPALEWLTAQRLSYRLLERLNHDDVIQTLRNNLAHAV